MCKTVLLGQEKITIMNSLSIGSNLHGYNDNRKDIINKVLCDHSFVLVQEHWLHNNQLNIFNSLNNVCFHAVSGMPSNDLLSGRHYGGCAIIWKSSFKCKIEPVTFQSNRLCGVIVSGDYISSPILLVSVYMPTDSTYDRANANEYNAVLNEITRLGMDLNISSTIIGGDFNTDLGRNESLHTKELNTVCHNNSLIPWLNCIPNSIDFTFESMVDG